MLASRLAAPLRWFQFGIRDLAWVSLVAALVFAWQRPSERGMVTTDRELDLAIAGRGYFIVKHFDSGRTGYVRHGKLSINSFGQLCYGRPIDGWVIEPQITFPSDHLDIKITHDGNVYYWMQNDPQPFTCGAFQLATFMAPEQLGEHVPGIYAESQAAGVPMHVNPGNTGAGMIQQGRLDTSADPTACDDVF